MQTARASNSSFSFSESHISKTVEDFIANKAFPCVGAKTALSKDQIQICRAGSIFSDRSDDEILEGLYEFIEKFRVEKAIFRSFIVVFDDREILPEIDFERGLWERLQSIHERDDRPWDETVSKDPSSEKFSFSAGGKSFYIVGMHPGASRQARRFPLPALVFNLHEQFEALREKGQYQSMKQLIRRRDRAFSGSSNPMLEDFGKVSEAIQYSGRLVEGEWRCPFHQKSVN